MGKKQTAKKPLDSRTIKFNMIMGAVQSINGSLALLQPVLSPGQFAAVTLIVGVLHTVGGIYLRYQTNTGISNA